MSPPRVAAIHFSMAESMAGPMVLTLRTRILLFLFLFALAPLLLAVLLNLPLVLDRAELFYRHAFLQNLRADFRDLDQHLASRDEMVRLLARLPEPGLIIGQNAENGPTEQAEIDRARARYAEWINRILQDQFDITTIQFFNQQGHQRFWLERDPKDQSWQPTLSPPRKPPEEALAAVRRMDRLGVLLTPIRIDMGAEHPNHVMTTQLLSPIGPSEGEPVFGSVAITIDIGGLARREAETLWVQPDGQYLNLPGMPYRPGNAFIDFPGLEQQFEPHKIVLWESPQGQAIWVPMFRTEDDEPLWVGRRVNRKPLEEFQTELTLRVLGIILVLVVTIWLVARWVARRAERFGANLLNGLRQMLEGDEAVVFNWRGGRELQELGDGLTRLSQTHARNSRNLRAHARELEQSNRYKSEFLANVSHELRTPLNSILLLSKLLAEENSGLDAERQQQATVINEAGKDLKALIENILDLSRIEAGQLEVHVEPVALAQLLGDLQELMRPQFEAKGLTLELELATGAPIQIQSDADKIRQILKNFLSNAVKFTRTGGAWIRLSAAQAPYAVRLSVSDSGIGIPRDKQQVIFEAFKQADGSTSRRYGGTGLGLSISRELAELLGGEITVRSAPDQGTSFDLLLPADCGCAPHAGPKTQPTEDAEQPAAPPAEAPRDNCRGRRVLLLDNNVRRLLRLTPILENWGAEVVVAGDADEALEAMDERPVDLALVDCEMSGFDAYATIERMRSHSAHTDLAVIALINDASAENREFILESGADDFILAIPSPVELSEVIERHLPPGEAGR